MPQAVPMLFAIARIHPTRFTPVEVLSSAVLPQATSGTVLLDEKNIRKFHLYMKLAFAPLSVSC